MTMIILIIIIIRSTHLKLNFVVDKLENMHKGYSKIIWIVAS